MLCPRCASTQTDDIKFCTSCGANLEAVREVLERRESGKKVRLERHLGRGDVQVGPGGRIT